MKNNTKKNMFKKILSPLLLIFVCFNLVGCSAVESMIKKIPFFEEADIDSLTDKAEKAWNEVGKDALKDAAENAANTLLDKGKALSWPESDTMKDIPEVSTGVISKIDEKETIVEITVKEITLAGYDEYVNVLNDTFGASTSTGIYRLEDRLLSAIYDEENSTLIITVSVIKQTIEVSVDTSCDESEIESETESVESK